MRRFILKLMFPGTLEEYAESKKIHLVEMRVYRRRWHFILGLLLLGIPSSFLIIGSGAAWLVKIETLSMVAGFVFTHNAITQHYCLKLLRERKAQSRQ